MKNTNSPCKHVYASSESEIKRNLEFEILALQRDLLKEELQQRRIENKTKLFNSFVSILPPKLTKWLYLSYVLVVIYQQVQSWMYI